MNLPLRIASRYLFTKRTTNAINIITGIAVLGISIGTAALLLVLSVFNGFEDLIVGMYSHFNPEVKVTPKEGKTFIADDTLLLKLEEMPGIQVISVTLEEVAVFEYKDNQTFGIIKGVDENFARVTDLDSTLREGKFQLGQAPRYFAVLGAGMRNKLAVDIEDMFSSISVYMPKRKEVGPFDQQFMVQSLYPAGTFAIQQDFDQEYVLADLGFTRKLLGLPDAASALEIKLEPGYNIPSTFRAIQSVMGEGFRVQNRFEQEESFFKLMKLEKWLSYAIAGLMMLLVAFNLVGALWMIVLEKQWDIAILKSMGSNNNMVRNIFLYEGLLLSFLGVFIGFILAATVYILQKDFGLIGVPGNAAVDAYPISMRGFDFAVVMLTVLVIGFLASLPPAMRAKRIPAIIREE